MVDENTVLVLHKDGSITVQGEGFASNSDIKFYLFSTATAVGTTTANSDGTMSATFDVPAGISAGLHTLQVVGFAPDGSSRVLNLGVRVVDTTTATSSAAALATTGVDVSGVLGGALLVLLAGLAVTVLPRRRASMAA